MMSSGTNNVFHAIPSPWVVCPICGFQRGYELEMLICRSCRVYVAYKEKREVVGIAYDAFLEGRKFDACTILRETASLAAAPTAIVTEWDNWSKAHPPKHR